MSTLTLHEAEPAIESDDFTALEDRIRRTVELVKHERAARAEADRNAARLQSLLDAQTGLLEQAKEQLKTLERERDQVRQRVERLLKQIDEIA